MRTPTTTSPRELRPATEAPRPRKALRYALGGLLAFLALNAFGGGYYGLAGAEQVPREWLAGSPFDDYRVPSLILIVAVGGSALAAALAVFAGLSFAVTAALGAVLILAGWLAVQVAIIGYVSWMQPTTAIAGALILVLALRLRSRARSA